jgi:cell division protein FtsW (lipid II flippase)
MRHRTLLHRAFSRRTEALLLVAVALVALLGFAMVHARSQVARGSSPLAGLADAWAPPLALIVGLYSLHFVLAWRHVDAEQLVLPLVGLLLAIGLLLLWRLLPPWATWQQLTRGLLPGLAAIALLALFPGLVERLRSDWPVTSSVVGLVLLVATAFAGVRDEAGARLALKIGPLPAIQTSELVKLSLIVFLSWYIESEGRAAHGRVWSLGPLRLPPVRYVIPGTLFVSLAALALVKMSDLGAILILGALFAILLYVGFERRVFLTIVAIGLALSLVAGVVLARYWQLPAALQLRLAAFADPWSEEPLTIDGQPTGLTIAEGPGYQIQQAVYAIVDGGITGTGIGAGTPENVPLAHSDMIFAAVAEELGAVGALAVLACFAILLLRILRVAMLLPAGQVFERLLLVGIAAHLFAQVFVMVGGTVNLLPLTGVTIPFLSQGGVALTVNLLEIGLVLAIAQRLGKAPA